MTYDRSYSIFFLDQTVVFKKVLVSMAPNPGLSMINLHPEQIRALDYLRRKGTQAPVQQLYAQMEAAFTALEELLSTVPPAHRALHPREEAWSVQEVVDHLVLTHRLAAVELRGLIEGRRPQGKPIPANLLSSDPFSIPWETLIEQLRAVHRELLDIVGKADDTVRLDVRAPLVMVVNVPGMDGAPKATEWLHEVDWKAYAQAFRVHTLQHLEQIKRNMTEISPP